MKKDLIVVLNDNEMSIAKNVGVLSSFLSRKLSAKHFMAFREELKVVSSKQHSSKKVHLNPRTF